MFICEEVATMEPDIHDWLDALVGAAREFAREALGEQNVSLLEEHDEIPEDGSSSYIALLGDKAKLQIGIAASREHSRRLAEWFVDPGCESRSLSLSDVVDALGEDANVIGGLVKAHMREHEPMLQLGLPLVFNGSVSRGGRTREAAADIEIGDLYLRLVVLMG